MIGLLAQLCTEYFSIGESEMLVTSNCNTQNMSYEFLPIFDFPSSYFVLCSIWCTILLLVELLKKLSLLFIVKLLKRLLVLIFRAAVKIPAYTISFFTMNETCSHFQYIFRISVLDNKALDLDGPCHMIQF